MDALLGAFLEMQAGSGEIFQMLLKEQFLRIRDADRYWYANYQNG